MFQRFGTDKVGSCFAPVLLIWFHSIAAIGIYNFLKYDTSAIRAINPKYIIDYFARNKKDAWLSLGGVVLCITGRSDRLRLRLRLRLRGVVGVVHVHDF